MKFSQLTLLFYLILNFNGTAQESVELNKFSFAIRGKYYAFGILEDTYWRAYNYGGEFYLFKRHVVGIDGGVFRWRFEQDDSDDVEMYSEIKRRSYMFMDYKFLFPINSDFVLYAQCFTKLFGKRMEWNKKYNYSYPIGKDLNFLNATGRGYFTDYGIGPGIKYYFNESNFGIDANINFFMRRGRYTYSKYDETTGWSSINESDNTFGCYLRFTLFYHFFRY